MPWRLRLPLSLTLTLLLLASQHRMGVVSAQASNDSLQCSSINSRVHPAVDQLDGHRVLAATTLNSYVFTLQHDPGDDSVHLVRRVALQGDVTGKLSLNLTPSQAAVLDLSQPCQMHSSKQHDLVTAWCGAGMLQVTVSMYLVRDKPLVPSGETDHVISVCASQRLHDVAMLTLSAPPAPASPIVRVFTNDGTVEAVALPSDHTANLTLVCSNDSGTAAVVYQRAAPAASGAVVLLWNGDPAASVAVAGPELPFPVAAIPGVYHLDGGSDSLYFHDVKQVFMMHRLRLLHRGSYNATFSASCVQATAVRQGPVDSSVPVHCYDTPSGQDAWHCVYHFGPYWYQYLMRLLTPDLDCTTPPPGTLAGPYNDRITNTRALPYTIGTDLTSLQLVTARRPEPPEEQDSIALTQQWLSCARGCGVTPATFPGTWICRKCQQHEYTSLGHAWPQLNRNPTYVCGTCPAGTFFRPLDVAAPRAASCVACARGTYAPTPGSTECVNCQVEDRCPIASAVQAPVPGTSAGDAAHTLLAAQRDSATQQVCAQPNLPVQLIVPAVLLVLAYAMWRAARAASGRVPFGTGVGDGFFASLDWYTPLRHGNKPRELGGVATLLVALVVTALIWTSACEVHVPASDAIHPGWAGSITSPSEIDVNLRLVMQMSHFVAANGTACANLYPQISLTGGVDHHSIQRHLAWSVTGDGAMCTISLSIEPVAFTDRHASLKLRVSDAWATSINATLDVETVMLQHPDTLDTASHVEAMVLAPPGGVLRGNALHRVVTLTPMDLRIAAASPGTMALVVSHVASQEDPRPVEDVHDLFAGDIDPVMRSENLDSVLNQLLVQFDMSLANYRIISTLAQGKPADLMLADASGLLFLGAVAWLLVAWLAHGVQQYSQPNAADAHQELEEEEMSPMA